MRDPNKAKTDPLDNSGSARDRAIDRVIKEAVNAWINDDMKTAEEFASAAERFCYSTSQKLFDED